MPWSWNSRTSGRGDAQATGWLSARRFAPCLWQHCPDHDMAILIPNRSACLPRMTAGERRFVLRLEEKLEDDYLIWYDVPIGPKQRQPDFVLLHPNRGLLVLEVKDWKIDTLHSIDKFGATLATERGHVVVGNPLAQARVYATELARLLEHDSALCFPPGHAQAGKMLVPWGHGVVLTRISRSEFDANEMGEVIPAHQVICQDEMLESVDALVLQQRLWAMFSVPAGVWLSLPEIDRIRWHLFPEIRISSPIQGDLLAGDVTPITGQALLPDIVRVMDLQQEQLARSLGKGHRVIHGVAGSGKTMILGYRCLHLARQPGKPILVLCYNRTLAARLRQMLATQALQTQVDIRSFHSWCAVMLRTYNVPKPISNEDTQAFFAAQVRCVIRAVEQRKIPRGQYGAVLIDEGHDFEPPWLALVAQMVDPETNSLLLLYDDAQSIYAHRRRDFSFAKVGIEARGRTTILRLNYRNTYEILAAAKAIAGDLLQSSEGDEDAPHVIAPESVGRHGPEPKFIDCASAREEAETIVALIADARAQGASLNQIATCIVTGNTSPRLRACWSAKASPGARPKPVPTKNIFSMAMPASSW
jgi:Nuclease-related domain/AAA domain